MQRQEEQFPVQSMRSGVTLRCVEEPRDLSTEGEPPWPVVVIGAGAAGLFAGLFAAMKGARVLILESKEKPGAKIRVSGGGRCNILPSKVSLENFHSSGSVKTLRNILLSWPLDSVRAFIEDTLELPLALDLDGEVASFVRSALESAGRA